MAERRMFTTKIVESDPFTEMPLSAQALYFHLNMAADDDGFVNNPQKIRRSVAASADDFEILVAKRFLLIFENGLVLIKHWRMHNSIRKDRYKPTQYQEQLSSVHVKGDGAYTEKKALQSDEDDFGNQLTTKWQPTDNQWLPQDSIGEVSIDKVNIDKKKNEKEIRHKYGEYSNVLLSDVEYEKLKSEFPSDYTERIENLSSYIASTGKTYKNHLATIRNWAKKDKANSSIPKHGSFDVNDAFKRALNRSRIEPEMHTSTNTKIAADDPAVRERMEALKQLCGQK